MELPSEEFRKAAANRGQQPEIYIQRLRRMQYTALGEMVYVLDLIEKETLKLEKMREKSAAAGGK
jgi:hypothetical protein